MTQCERILRHLEDHGSLTQAEAMQEYGIMRLSARIWDLRHRGHEIRQEMVRDKNRYGEPVSFARYTLEGEV